MTESSGRFQATITSSGSLFSPIDPRAVPVRLERIWNKADELVLDIYPEDRLTKTDLSGEFLLIKRGDKVSLIIESFTVFVGEVIDTTNIRGDAKNRLQLTCIDFGRFLSEVQLDRAIFNGYRDRVSHDVSDLLTTPLLSSIRPIAAAQYWRPQGWFDIRGLSAAANLNYNVLFNQTTGAAPDIRFGWLFRPGSESIERLLIPMNNLITDPTGVFGENLNRFDRDITFEFQTVTNMPTTAELHPSGTPLLTRAGRPARYVMITKLREVWQAITAGIQSGAFSSANSLTWVAASAGTSEVRIINWSPGTAFGFFASDRYCQLDYDGASGAVSVETAAPSKPSVSGGIIGDFEVPPTGWLSFQNSFLNANDFTGAMEVFVGSGNGDHQLAARIVFSGGNISIEDNTGLTQFKSNPDLVPDIDSPGDAVHAFHFRVRPERLEFDFSYTDGTTSPRTHTEVLRNAEFIAKDTFSTRPTRMTKWRFEITGGANPARWNIGGIDGTELGRTNQFIQGDVDATFAVLDITDDPIDLAPGEWVSIVASTDPAANSDGIGITVSFEGSINAGNQRQTTGSTFSDDGGTTWLVASTLPGGTNQLDYPLLIEFTDSWINAFEGRDFLVDYDNDFIDWGLGTNRFGPLKSSRTFPDPIGSIQGPGQLPTVRVSEYENPSTRGIINATEKMRVPDVVKHLVGFRSALIPTTIVDGGRPTGDLDVPDGIDDVDGVGYNTAEFEIDVYVVQQSSVMDALRDLADEYKAIISLSPADPPTFLFERAKIIEGFDSFAPGDHEFTLSMTKALFPLEDALRLGGHNVGIVEGEVFTTFPVYGADVSIQVAKTNDALVAELGRDMEAPPDTFRKETDETKLWRFSETKEEVMGIRLVEGEVTVRGYWPPSPPGPSQGRLDLNAIVRIADPNLPGGTGITAGDTENIFKVERIVFEGDQNLTTLFVSNRNLHRARIERLDELRNILNGVEPAKPEKDIRRRGRKLATSLSGTGVGPVWAGLFVAGSELNSIGYRRAQTRLRVHTDGTMSFTAYFPESVGTIKSDMWPLDEVRLFGFSGRTQILTITGTADGFYTVVIDSVVYSFNASGNTIEEIRDGVFAALAAVPDTVPVIITTDGTDQIFFTSIGSTQVLVSAGGPSGNFTLTVNTGIATFDFSDQRDVMYKWDFRTLHFVLGVTDSDQ